MAGIKAGRSNIDDVTDNDIMKMKCDRFCTIADPNAAVESAAALDSGPDLSGDRDCPGQSGGEGAGFLESTTYPGTISDVVRPVLNASGSVAGVDFNLAFSPERFDPGNQEFGPQNTAR